MKEKLDNYLDWKRSGSRQFWKNVSENRHVLQVYDNDHVLQVALRGFARAAVGAGENLIVVASQDHIARLSRSLRLFGIDIDELRISRQVCFVDASELLAKFMVDGMPDRSLFCSVLDDLLSSAGDRGGRPVKVYGEMVALLWAQGNHEATVALEEMWNGECSERNIHLFCGYPVSLFTDKDHGKMLHICGQHATLLNGTVKTHTDVIYRPTGRS